MKEQKDDGKKQISRKQDAIFKKLGYNPESIGASYFLELIEYLKIEYAEEPEKKLSEKEDQKQILSDCLELYAFGIECGKKNFNSRLLEFFNKTRKSSHETFEEYLERADKIIVKETVKYYNSYVINGEKDKNSDNNYKLR